VSKEVLKQFKKKVVKKKAAKAKYKGSRIFSRTWLVEQDLARSTLYQIDCCQFYLQCQSIYI